MASSLSSTLAGGSDDYHGCDSCGDDTVDYVGYCLDCKDYLCNYCFNSHRRLRYFRQHVLLDKQQTPSCRLSPDQQLASDIVDDRSRNSHHVQGPIPSKPTQPAWRTQFTPRRLLVAILVLLLAAWIAWQSRERVSHKGDNQAVIRDIDSTKIVDKRASSNYMYDTNQKEEEQDGIYTEVNHKENQHVPGQILDQKGSMDTELNQKIGQEGSVNTDTSGIPGHFDTDTDGKQEQRNKETYQTSDEHPQINYAKRVEDVKVVTEEDNAIPDISDCVVLPNNKLVVVDDGNSKVKLIDLTTNNVQSQLELPKHIWGITKVSSDQVAITCVTEQRIYFVNVSDTLQIHNDIKVNGSCRGIAYIEDGLIVSYDNPARMEMINMKGRVLYIIDTGDAGDPLFHFPWYIAIGRDQTTLYITDWRNNTVSRMTWDVDGSVKYKVHLHKHLNRPVGVAIDNAGNVYVCGGGSNNVIHSMADLSQSWEMLQFLVKPKDGSDKPRSVCICETTDIMFIGMRSNEVASYQLTYINQ